jgi:hypothetical protein
MSCRCTKAIVYTERMGHAQLAADASGQAVDALSYLGLVSNHINKLESALEAHSLYCSGNIDRLHSESEVLQQWGRSYVANELADANKLLDANIAWYDKYVQHLNDISAKGSRPFETSSATWQVQDVMKAKPSDCIAWENVRKALEISGKLFVCLAFTFMAYVYVVSHLQAPIAIPSFPWPSATTNGQHKHDLTSSLQIVRSANPHLVLI